MPVDVLGGFVLGLVFAWVAGGWTGPRPRMAEPPALGPPSPSGRARPRPRRRSRNPGACGLLAGCVLARPAFTPPRTAGGRLRPVGGLVVSTLLAFRSPRLAAGRSLSRPADRVRAGLLGRFGWRWWGSTSGRGPSPVGLTGSHLRNHDATWRVTRVRQAVMALTHAASRSRAEHDRRPGLAGGARRGRGAARRRGDRGAAGDPADPGGAARHGGGHHAHPRRGRRAGPGLPLRRRSDLPAAGRCGGSPTAPAPRKRAAPTSSRSSWRTGVPEPELAGLGAALLRHQRLRRLRQGGPRGPEAAGVRARSPPGPEVSPEILAALPGTPARGPGPLRRHRRPARRRPVRRRGTAPRRPRGRGAPQRPRQAPRLGLPGGPPSSPPATW